MQLVLTERETGSTIGAGIPVWTTQLVLPIGFVLIALRLFRCISSDRLELRGTARLLSTVLARKLLLRGGLLALGAVVLPLLLLWAFLPRI